MSSKFSHRRNAKKIDKHFVGMLSNMDGWRGEEEPEILQKVKYELKVEPKVKYSKIRNRKWHDDEDLE
ncbi:MULTISPECIES: hypothetical protein [Komagataeibacter]|uniref:hypothetical protein n=1 Tax=Komagataeibacter TaxID=1434011 RepID=UPI0011B4B7C8|nr:hypothetical protein [Komagataeibacter nataicola]WNM10286.1 hypothetical protein RI056_18475 [Komagataeibacter nataicola]GBR23464.1 hypothetical protein AA0616_2529 [Komagataeibacter nataicola NRIC 0616]